MPLRDPRADKVEAMRLLCAGVRGAPYALLLEAAEAGDAEALGSIGVAHYVGVGADLDGLLARQFLAEGAALGNALAAHNLGTLYFTGAPGVPANTAKGRLFHELAHRLDPSLGVADP